MFLDSERNEGCIVFTMHGTTTQSIVFVFLPRFIIFCVFDFYTILVDIWESPSSAGVPMLFSPKKTHLQCKLELRSTIRHV